jgi:hypothetical protein
VRVFQNAGLYPAYLPRLAILRDPSWTFERQRAAFLSDGYGAAHVLLPVISGDSNAFFTNSDDDLLQRQWAREQGMPSGASLEAVLLAQLEQHRTEIFYNQDPMRYQSDFVRRLPACVRKSIAWRAAPSPGANFSEYDLVVCNFPTILNSYRQLGWRAAYFSPAHHPIWDSFAANRDRATDIVFVGGYTRHHRRRSELLEAVAALKGRFKVEFHLDRSRMTRLAESIPGRLLPLAKQRRPKAIRNISRPPIFGLELYSAMSRAKIVLNGAIDMAGQDRGNLRCFESMGCGALMVSDNGTYPPGMVDGVNMLTYESPQHAASIIEKVLQTPDRLTELANGGFDLMRSRYSKMNQWQQFKQLTEAL